MKAKKNEQIAAAVLKPTELVDGGAEARRLNPKEPRDLEKLIGLAAKVAGSTIYCGNWKFKNALTHFPHEPMLRTVEKYFPHASGGPLYVDQPATKLEEAECHRKAVALEKEGLRYVIITKEMELGDVEAQLKRKATA